MALVILPEPAVQQTLNIDDLAVTLDGSSVLSHLYAYDAAGDNWDRLRIGAAAGSLLVSLAAGGGAVDTELPPAVAAAENLANPTAPFVLSAGMLFDGATWDRWPGNSVDGALVNTELPAAAALADAAANPTTPTVGVGLLGFNGATWDRLRSDIANGLDVDVTRVSGTVTVDSELPAAAALADAAANPTTPTVGAALLVWNGGSFDRAFTAIADGTAPVQNIRAASMGYLFNGATWDRFRGDVANGLDVDVTRVTGTVTVDSELPAAALLVDNTATPTAPAVGAFNMVFDGATWDFLRGNAAGGVFVQGPVADGGAAAGGPVFIGAVEGATIRGLISTQLGADARAAPIANLETASKPSLFNGTNWDRQRNNHEITALASAARVATTTSVSLTNYNARGMTIQLDVTAVGAPAGTVTLIEVLTLVGTTEVVLYAFDIVDLGAIGTRHLLVYPGAASPGSWSLAPAQGVVPRVFRIRVTHLDANSITYSVVCSMIN